MSATLCFGQSLSGQIDHYAVSAKKMEKRLKYDSAFMFYDSAILLAKQQNDSLYLNYIECLASSTFVTKNELDTAKVILTKVWSYAYKNQNDTLRARTENILGWINYLESRMASALQYYNSALEISEKSDYKKGLFNSYYNLTNYYLDRDEYNTSLDYALKGIRLAENEHFSQDDYMRAVFNLGNVYEKFAFYDSAESCYNRVFEYGIQNENFALAYNSLSNKALIYTRIGRMESDSNHQEKALDYYKKANELIQHSIEIVKPTGNQKLLAYLYNTLSISYKKLGDYNAAMENYQKALQYAKSADDGGNQIRILKNIGMLLRDKRDFKMAKKYFDEALELAIKNDSRQGMAELYKSMSVLFEEMGDYKQAFLYSNKYIELKLSIIAQEKIENSQEMLFLFEREKDRAMIKDLETQNKISQLEREKLKFERRALYIVASSAIVILLLVLLFFRMKVRKNRVIAQHRIQKLEDEKRLMESQSVMIGEENERKRIAQELHDGIGVLLSTASIQFSGITSKVNDPGTVELINKAGKFLKEAGQEVRKISQNMMPSVLSKFGLREALEDIFDEIEDTGQIETNVMIESDNVRLPENMEIMLYRVVQELANNTIKHSRATKIIFSFVKKIDVIEIDFQDNGVGFDPNGLPHNKSLGIYGIRSRVDYLKGTVDLESSPGEGTKYYIKIPVAT